MLYISRVSTLDKQNIDNQVILLKKNIAKLEILSFIKNIQIKSLVQKVKTMIRYVNGRCKERRIDAIMVYKFDRFSRSLATLINSLELLNNL